MSTARTAPPRRRQRADWRSELRSVVRTLDALEAVLRLSDEERDGVRRSLADGFPLAVAPHYLSLADAEDPSCPVRLQFVPRTDEWRPAPGDLADPLGEEDAEHAVAPDLVLRYPDRALLLVTDRCTVHCRFCTRRRFVGSGGGARSLARLEPAMRWIERHEEVGEVIVSGGDPLTLQDERIERILGRIRRIPHVGVIRIASRMPVTVPARVTPSLAALLSRFHPVWLMTQFNHPRECTDEAMAACEILADAGVPVMNQTVLLSGVNSCACVLERLFRRLVRSRVRPYYLLQCDPVVGSGHLRTRTSVGVRILEALQGRLSGLSMPRLVVDTPGGHGKVPLAPDSVVARSAEAVVLRTWRGTEVECLEPRSVERRPVDCRCGD